MSRGHSAETLTGKQHQEQHNKSNNHFSNSTELPREQQQQPTSKKRWSGLDLFQSASLCKKHARGKTRALKKTYLKKKKENKNQPGEGHCGAWSPPKPVVHPAGLRPRHHPGTVNLWRLAAQQQQNLKSNSKRMQ